MSNRRRLPSEKARRPRCARCKSRDVLLKTGYGYVCQRDNCGHTTPATTSEPDVAHRWGGVFTAACGVRGGIRIAPDEERVTCPDCLALPADPALWAERDQFAAAVRDVQQAQQPGGR